MTMTAQRAKKIAREHLAQTNPNNWNGIPPKPQEVDAQVKRYSVNANNTVRIYFTYTPDRGWIHCCELWDNRSGNLKAMGHGPGVDSVENLSKTLQNMLPI